jgi:DNA-binding response OmpR family regulator
MDALPGPRVPVSWPPARILVVNDDAPLRDAVCEALMALGYAPDGVGSAAEALARFRPGRYDLVITDPRTGDVAGVQLARRLRAFEPTVPMLVLSGDAEGVEPSLDALAGLVERALTSA